MEEDDINEIGEDEKEKLNDVDYLTGFPLPNDILLYAVPVCAPHAAVQSYKYCVKIILGTTKKGKSCKNGDEFVWSHVGSKPMRERVDGGMYKPEVDGCDYWKRQDICSTTDRKVMCFSITYGFCLVRLWVRFGSSRTKIGFSVLVKRCISLFSFTHGSVFGCTTGLKCLV
ncbi:putative NFACT protein [Helianthus anomalus]